jgi:hypothetical protein
MSTFHVRVLYRRSVAILCTVVVLTGSCCMPPPEAPTSSPLTADWTNLQRLGLASVIVTLDSGDTVKGNAERVTDTGLYVTTDGTITRFFARDSIVRVVQVTSEAGSRAKTGALVGVGLGASLIFLGGPGFWFTLLTDPALCAGLGALSGIPRKREVVIFERRF